MGEASGEEPKGWKLAEPVNALGPIAPNGSWSEEGNTILATGTAAPWTVLTKPVPGYNDYRLSVKVAITKPTPKADFPINGFEFDRYLPREMFPPGCPHTGQHRYRYYAGEFDWGSDAAVFVRYKSREDCYRVQLSTQYQEIILWHGVGGYLQVVPCDLKVGKTYDLEVVAEGTTIRVLVDGAEKINYRHETLPTRRGGIGLGAYHATIAFTDLRVDPLPAPPLDASDGHQARFNIRRWRTLSWIFDGNEPIALLTKFNPPIKASGSGVFYYLYMKLKPGYRPYYQSMMSVITYSGGKGTTTLVGDVASIKKTGENTGRLVLKFQTEHPKKVCRADHVATLTYDRARGTYRHDVDVDVEFLAEQKMHSFEFCDPLSYNNKFPGRGVEYGWLPSGHIWGVVSGEDGKLYRHPLSQSLSLPGQNSFLSGPDKGFWMLYPDRAASPVWEYSVPGERFLAEVCHWGYDFHQRVRWPDSRKPKIVKPGDRMKIHHVLTAYPPAEAKRLFDAAPLHPKQEIAKHYKHERYLRGNTPNMTAFPVCDPAGTDFTRLQSVRVPYIGWQFRGKYQLDTAVGHNDTHSLRMDGPGESYGEFYHHMIDGYAKRYLCTFWLKTKGVTGEGPVVQLKYTYADDPCDRVETNLTGDTDWQKFSFVTTVPVIAFESYDASSIVLTTRGEGTVWLDDFSVVPLKAGQKATDVLPAGSKLIRIPAKSRKFW